MSSSKPTASWSSRIAGGARLGAVTSLAQYAAADLEQPRALVVGGTEIDPVTIGPGDDVQLRGAHVLATTVHRNPSLSLGHGAPADAVTGLEHE